ncbi:CocE/NonD family hydrolase [Streptomyces sp. NPDC002677]|uniref:CocE/NonD family hydrolase n=1 Tax=Streptomyces sp. NPDC002677 TaxID=3154774 RepID=UPI003333CBCB
MRHGHVPTDLQGGPATVERPTVRPRCNASVGTAGASWDGCIFLRTAALAPEPLKAVAVARSTDGHHDNDARYGGGSALTVDTRAWTAFLPAAGSMSPPPPPKA